MGQEPEIPMNIGFTHFYGFTLLPTILSSILIGFQSGEYPEEAEDMLRYGRRWLRS